MNSSITSPPGKIVLNSSSKLSLHDRFTKLANTRKETVGAGASSAAAAIGNKIDRSKPKASIKNRNLALSMGNRPSVQAALKIKKKSMKQRLGAITRRAGEAGAARRTPGKSPKAGAGIDPSRLSGGALVKKRLSVGRVGARGRGGLSARPSLASRLSGLPKNNPGGGNRRGGFNQGEGRIRRVGAGRGMGVKGRVQPMGNKKPLTPNKNGRIQRFNLNRIKSHNQLGQKYKGGKPQQQQKQQGQQVPKNRENLDMDLDQYMAKSKSHLDQDLDSYMAQASTI